MEEEDVHIGGCLWPEIDPVLVCNSTHLLITTFLLCTYSDTTWCGVEGHLGYDDHNHIQEMRKISLDDRQKRGAERGEGDGKIYLNVHMHLYLILEIKHLKLQILRADHSYKVNIMYYAV